MLNHKYLLTTYFYLIPLPFQSWREGPGLSTSLDLEMAPSPGLLLLAIVTPTLCPLSQLALHALLASVCSLGWHEKLLGLGDASELREVPFHTQILSLVIISQPESTDLVSPSQAQPHPSWVPCQFTSQASASVSPTVKSLFAGLQSRAMKVQWVCPWVFGTCQAQDCYQLSLESLLIVSL